MLRAALAERLAGDVALYEAGFTTALLAPLATPVHWVRRTFDDLPATTGRRSAASWSGCRRR